MQWFLVLSLYTCNGGGPDPGIVPGNCYNREVRVQMPSLEICRQARAVNQNSKCLSEEFDKP